jgi:hypothetical protein
MYKESKGMGYSINIDTPKGLTCVLGWREPSCKVTYEDKKRIMMFQEIGEMTFGKT